METSVEENIEQAVADLRDKYELRVIEYAVIEESPLFLMALVENIEEATAGRIGIFYKFGTLMPAKAETYYYMAGPLRARGLVRTV